MNLVINIKTKWIDNIIQKIYLDIKEIVYTQRTMTENNLLFLTSLINNHNFMNIFNLFYDSLSPLKIGNIYNKKIKFYIYLVSSINYYLKKYSILN